MFVPLVLPHLDSEMVGSGNVWWKIVIQKLQQQKKYGTFGLSIVLKIYIIFDSKYIILVPL